MNDPQIDPFQLSMLQQWGWNEVSIGSENKRITGFLNPHDLSDNDFYVGGKAWQLYRRKEIDPEKFGPEGAHGIKSSLLRDFAALNKIEVVPYLDGAEIFMKSDSWRLMNVQEYDLTPNELDLLDYIAEITLNNMQLIYNTYRDNPSLHVPSDIISRV